MKQQAQTDQQRYIDEAAIYAAVERMIKEFKDKVERFLNEPG